MALSVPSLSDLSQSVRAALRKFLPGTDALIWPNTLAIEGKVFAAVMRNAYLRLAFLYRQFFASTADEFHLERRHAYEIGIARNRASRATGTVTTTGTADATYPAGIRWLSGTDTYVSTAAATADGDGALAVSVRAETPGASGNRSADEALTLADSAIWPSLGTQAIVGEDGLGGGADVEDVESLRERVLDRKRRPPQGGAESDYEQFARDVTGVTNAWAKAFADGPGTIGVWFLFEGRTNGIPEAADVEAVQTAIDALRMIRLAFVANAPTPVEVDVTVALDPDTTTLRATVQQRIADMLVRRARPGLPDDSFVLPVAWISEAISQTVGEDSHTLTVPAADLTFTAGQYPVLGTVTFV